MSDHDEECTCSEKLVEAKKALENAIYEYNKTNAEEHGMEENMVLTDWVLVVSAARYQDMGTSKCAYFYETADGQAPHRTSGLLSYAQDRVF